MLSILLYPPVLCLSLPLSVFIFSSLLSLSSEKIFCSLWLTHLAEVLLGISGSFLDGSWVEFPKSINLGLMLYKRACQTLNTVRQPQNVGSPHRFLSWVTSPNKDTVASTVTQQKMTTGITSAHAGRNLPHVHSFLLISPKHWYRYYLVAACPSGR